MSLFVLLGVIIGMLVGMSRAMLVKLLGAVGALELMTLAGNSNEAGNHQYQGGKAFHRAASYLATTERQPRSDGKTAGTITQTSILQPLSHPTGRTLLHPRLTQHRRDTSETPLHF
jgi:hypothetical protein